LHGSGWGSWLCGSFLTVGGNLFDAGDGSGGMDGRAALAMTALGCGDMDGRAALAMTAACLRHRERSVAIHGALASGWRHPGSNGNDRPICAMGVAEGYGDAHGKHFDLIWQGARLAPGAGASCNTGVKWVQ